MVYPVHCHHFRSPWGSQSHKSTCVASRRQDSWTCSKATQTPAQQCVHRGCHHVRISSLSESRTCLTRLGLSDNQTTSIPTWGYDKYELNLLKLYIHTESAGLRRVPRRFPTNSPVDPQIPGYKLNHLHRIPSNPPRMPLYGHVSVFARLAIRSR
jgi:hypothetical protein